jgi:hypothetical protein
MDLASFVVSRLEAKDCPGAELLFPAPARQALPYAVSTMFPLHLISHD